MDILQKIAKGFLQLLFAGALLVIGFFILMHTMSPSAPDAPQARQISTAAPTPTVMHQSTTYTKIIPEDYYSPENARPCDLVSGYQIGMTLDEFKAIYAEKYKDEPSCRVIKYEDGTCKGCSTCEGQMAIGVVPVRAKFSFGGERLFSIGAKFDSYRFREMKTELSNLFGYDSSDSECRALTHPDTITPEDIRNINAYGGCESLMWIKHGIAISLNQIPGVSGEQFSMFPTDDLKQKKYSSCPQLTKPPDSPEETARKQIINTATSEAVLCVNVFMELARRKGYKDSQEISNFVTGSCSDHFTSAGFSEPQASDMTRKLVETRIYNQQN